MAAQDYTKLFGEKKTPKDKAKDSDKPKKKNMNESEKLDIQTLKDEMTQRIKKDPELAQKAAQLIIDLLNDSKKTKK